MISNKKQLILELLISCMFWRQRRPIKDILCLNDVWKKERIAESTLTATKIELLSDAKEAPSWSPISRESIWTFMARFCYYQHFTGMWREISNEPSRSGRTSTWSGTSRTTGRSATSESPRNTSGNPTSSCTTGLCVRRVFAALPFPSFQCWRSFWRDVSHECDCYKRGNVHLHPARNLQVHLQDRHHLVPLWRPGLRHEVRELDVRRLQGRPQAEGGGRGPGHVHQQWGVGSSKWDWSVF